VLFSACGGAPVVRDTLALAELELVQGDRPVLRVHADGAVEAEVAPGKWIRALQLSRDGAVVHDGTLVGQLQPSGQFRTRHRVRFRFENDVLVVGAYRIAIAQDGTVSGGLSDRGRLWLRGGNDARARRTALLVLALLGPERVFATIELARVIGSSQ
jgi:hypothetical protein